MRALLSDLPFTFLKLFAERGRKVVERADPFLEVSAERDRPDQVSSFDGRMRHRGSRVVTVG